MRKAAGISATVEPHEDQSMIRLTLPAIAVIFAAANVSASEQVALDPAIQTKLQDAGYEVIYAERYHDRLELKARRSGRMYELKIDPKTGQILKVEDDD